MMQMTGNVINLVASALIDPEEDFSTELEETGTSVTECLRNILQLSSGGWQPKETTQVNG